MFNRNLLSVLFLLILSIPSSVLGYDNVKIMSSANSLNENDLLSSKTEDSETQILDVEELEENEEFPENF